MKQDKQNELDLKEAFDRGAQYCSAKVAADRSAFIKAEDEKKAKTEFTPEDIALWKKQQPFM